LTTSAPARTATYSAIFRDTTLGSDGAFVIPLIELGKKIHHSLEGGNFEPGKRTGLRQPFYDRFGEAKQFQSNVLFACPVLKKSKHSQTSTADRFDFGKIQHNHPRGVLRLHPIAKLENIVAVDDPAFALKHRQVSEILHA
jgi:hypothetical protein